MKDKNSINKILVIGALIFVGWCIAIIVTVKPELIGFNFWFALAFGIIAFALSLVSILNAHADNEVKEKEFLRNTISDISHQLKTPLAALNIYNGLLQDEANELPGIKEFVKLSEQELDRIEILVQNLLKIAKLDADAITFEKNIENMSDMMKDIELHFAYQAKQEQKEIILSGSDDISLNCDHDWIMEVVFTLRICITFLRGFIGVAIQKILRVLDLDCPLQKQLLKLIMVRLRLTVN